MSLERTLSAVIVSTALAWAWVASSQEPGFPRVDYVMSGNNTAVFEATTDKIPQNEFHSVDGDGCVSTSCGHYCGFQPGPLAVHCYGGWVSVYPRDYTPLDAAWETDSGYLGLMSVNLLPELNLVGNPNHLPPGTEARAYEGQGMPPPHESGTSWTSRFAYELPERLNGGDLFSFWPLVSFFNGMQTRYSVVGGANDLTMPLNVTETLTIAVADHPLVSGDLVARVYAAHNPVDVGANTDVVLVAVNQGDDLLTDVLAELHLPAAFDVDADSVVPGMTVVEQTDGSRTLMISFDDLYGRQWAFATIRGAWKSAGNYTINASASHADPDPIAGNDSDSVEVVVADLADISVSLKTDQSPVLTDKEVGVEAIVRNRGPKPASVAVGVVLSENAAYSGSEDPVNHDGRVVSATIADLPADEIATISFRFIPRGGGDTVLIAAADVNGENQLDPRPGDNTAERTVRQLRSTDGFAHIVLGTSALGSLLGDMAAAELPGFPGVNIAAINKPYLSENGLFAAFRVRLDETDFSMDEAVAVLGPSGLSTVLREGITIIPSLGEVLGTIDAKLAVNDNGCIAVAARVQPSNRKAILVICPGGSPIVVALAGRPVPGLSGLSYSLLVEPNIDRHGVVRFVTTTTGGLTSQNQMLLATADNGVSATVLARTGVTIPSDQAGDANNTLQALLTESDFSVSGLYAVSGGFTVRGRLNGDTNFNEVLLRDLNVVAQRGVIFDDSRFTSPLGVSFSGARLTQGGRWIISGTNQDSKRFVATDDGDLRRVLAEADEPVAPQESEIWTSFVWGLANDFDRYAVAGFTNQSTQLAVVYDEDNPPRVFTRGSDPVAADGCFPGIQLRFYTTQHAVLLADGRVLAVVTVETEDGVLAGNALVSIDPTAAPGACVTNGGCTDVDPYACASMSGEFCGTGVPCTQDGDACPEEPPRGACCSLPDTACEDDLDPQSCEDAAGDYAGDGTVCAPGTCGGQIGACCDSYAGCEVTSQEDCEVEGNTWYLSVSCSPEICLLFEGAPCAQNEQCAGGACIFDLCKSPSEFGGPCEEDPHCTGGYVCGPSGTCTVPTGGSCTTNDDCVNTCISQVCTPPADTGGPCDPGDDDDCKPGNDCDGGTCRMQDGGSCTADDECAGECNEGTCGSPLFSLVVVKHAYPLAMTGAPAPPSPTFMFSSPTLGNFEIEVQREMNQPNIVPNRDVGEVTFRVPAGTHTITEKAEFGWGTPFVSCDRFFFIDPGTSAPPGTGETSYTVTADINPDVSDFVQCIFINEQVVQVLDGVTDDEPHGEIVIVKHTEDVRGDHFDFTIHGGTAGLEGDPLDRFTLCNHSILCREDRRRFFAPPGTYRVSENPQPGWRLDDVICDPPQVFENDAIIELAADETVTCTFVNSFVDVSSPCTTDHDCPLGSECHDGACRVADGEDAPGRLTIIKHAIRVPEGAHSAKEERFAFSVAGTAPGKQIRRNFTLRDGDHFILESQHSTEYEIREFLQAGLRQHGWVLEQITCDFGNPRVDLEKGILAVTVDAGDHVTCRFRNVQKHCVTTVRLLEVRYGGRDIGMEWRFEPTVIRERIPYPMGPIAMILPFGDVHIFNPPPVLELPGEAMDQGAPRPLLFDLMATEIDPVQNDVGNSLTSVGRLDCPGDRTHTATMTIEEIEFLGPRPKAKLTFLFDIVTELR